MCRCWAMLALLYAHTARADAPCANALACRRECFAGKPDSCVQLGLLMQYGGVKGNPRPLYARACSTKDPGDGCYHVQATRGAVEREDATAALAARSARCASGEGPSCLVAADLMEHGFAGPFARLKVIPLYDKACDSGDSHACVKTALHRLNAKLRGAPKFARRACELGDRSGCRLCAVMSDFPSETAIEERRRQIICAEHACNVGVASECRQQALLLLLIGNSDDARTADLYRRGCDGGDADSCCYLAFYFQEGRSVPKEPRRVAALQRTAAKLGRKCWTRGASPPPAVLSR